MISVCMIVKDEELYLRDTLIAIKRYFNDVIIVDTGSQDKTKEIAKEYTDKVYDYNWCNDFSDARNYSLSFADNSWILVIDSDEKIIDIDYEKIAQFINSSNEDSIGRITLINDIDDDNGASTYKEFVNRLFRKDRYKYQGKIHEQLVSVDGTTGEMVPIDLVVEHLGYTKQAISRTNKIYRNINMLKEAITNNPEDSYLFYQLGKSHYLNKDFKNANECFESALVYEKNLSLEYMEDLIETYGYSLINSGEYKIAKEILKFENHYNSAEFIFLKALIFMNNGEFKLSVEEFLKCTKMSESKIDGINSYKANYNIGVIFECLGISEEAKNYYLSCGEYIPAQQALKRIGNF